MSFQEFQKNPNRLTSKDIFPLVGIFIVIALVVSMLGIGNYYLANVLPEGGEFLMLYTAGRFFIFERIDPYSGTLPGRVQSLVYDRAALSGEDAYILDIPFHLLLLFLPLALIPDVVMARTIWLVLMEVALLVSIYFGFRLLKRRIPFVLVILAYLGAVLSFYSYVSLLEGSLSVLLGLVYFGILLSFRAGLDELTGALLLLSGFNLEIGFPFLLFITLMIIRERRWRVVNGMAMLGFLLMVLSFFLYPGWIVPFLRAAWNNITLGVGFSSHKILVHIWPSFGRMLGWVITFILIFVLGYEWNAARNPKSDRLLWVALLAIAAAPLLGYPIEMDQMILLTMPVVLVIVYSYERWKRFGWLISLLLFLFFFGVPWVFNVFGVPDKIKLSVNEALFLFWSISTVIGLYWIRWWFIHPPLTWMDTVPKMEKR